MVSFGDFALSAADPSAGQGSVKVIWGAMVLAASTLGGV
jgi:hypothetical protein